MKNLTAVSTVLFGSCIALGCKPSPPSAQQVMSKVASSIPDAGLSAPQVSMVMLGGNSLSATQDTATLANNMFSFDPTINPSEPTSANVSAIESTLKSNLSDASCASVTTTGDDITVDFGASPGCSFSDGTTVSGTVGLDVSQSGGTTTVALSLDDVTVDGDAVSGSASFATTNGTTFAVTTDLVADDKTYDLDLTVTGASGSYTVSGSGTVDESGATTNVAFTDVVVTKATCYASSGSVALTSGGSTETLTFDATTPQTGDVTVTVGKLTTTTKLPAYGACPSSTGASREALDASVPADASSLEHHDAGRTPPHKP